MYLAMARTKKMRLTLVPEQDYMIPAGSEAFSAAHDHQVASQNIDDRKHTPSGQLVNLVTKVLLSASCDSQQRHVFREI